jgi:hypothetical protein
MRAIIAIACLGLFLPIAPASAQHANGQREYALTVSVHEDVRPRLTTEDVKKILKGASELMRDNNCNVTFKLNGQVESFASQDKPATIKTASQRDAVHQVEADVKVVKEILFCRSDLGDLFNGCAFPNHTGSKSIIVTHARATTVPLRSILWAHEFGHRTGLKHRADSNALMTSCPNLFGSQMQVNRDECDCFLRGPENPCTRPDVQPACSTR